MVLFRPNPGIIPNFVLLPTIITSVVTKKMMLNLRQHIFYVTCKSLRVLYQFWPDNASYGQADPK